MPIVIQEIHIKAVVDESGRQSNNTAQSGGTDSSASKNEIIKECVEEIMRIIKEKTER